MSSTGDDCYFYYYSTCTKGKECPFRHCELALGTETVCTLWREGLCSRANCKFRHMESRINRTHIPCYWENQPGGCRKPHCVFFHKKLRTSSPAIEKSQGLIFPVSSQNPAPQVPLTPDVLPDSTKKFSSNEQTSENLPLNSPSVSVEPVVVRLIDEESDTESTASTPVKNLSNKISSFEQRLPQISDSEDRDFGIKTLEQLRMEKIHRESEHFYKSDIVPPSIIDNISQVSNLTGDSKRLFGSVYDAPLLEIPQMDNQIDPALDNKRYAAEGHRLGIYLKNLERIQDTSACKRKLNDTISNITSDSSEDDKLPSNDLRDIIRKKKRIEQNRSSPSPEPKKRVISLKKSDTLNDDSIMVTLSEKNVLKSQKPKEKSAKEEVEKPVKGSFDFKIKTLAEIRQEKNKKKTNSSVDENVAQLPKEEIVLPAPITTLRSAVQAVKPKMKRPAREIYQVKSSSLSPKKDFTTQETVNKRAKLSPSRKKPLSSVQRVNDILNSRELLNEKSKDISEIPVRRTLKFKRKITFENGHKESDKESENKTNNVTAHKKVSLRSIRSFIRPCVAPQLFPAKHTDIESSLTDENMQQQNNSKFPTQDISMDNDTVDSSKIEDEEQPQTNGIELTEANNKISNHNSQENDFNSRKSSSESLTRSISKTSSTTDDFDKLLFAEECGLNLDDFGDTTVKNDDSIFLEIDKLLES